MNLVLQNYLLMRVLIIILKEELHNNTAEMVENKQKFNEVQLLQGTTVLPACSPKRGKTIKGYRNK